MNAPPDALNDLRSPLAWPAGAAAATSGARSRRTWGRRALRLGVDLDNTLACYDGVFAAMAAGLGVATPAGACAKRALRDALRRTGREALWTAMQGEAYGPGMARATPFPGALEFLRACRELGVEVCIISHRTPTPYAGPAYDLHASAWGWLEANGFFDALGAALPRGCVFLEHRKEQKLLRIAQQACTHFVDDLPEFLALTPPGVARVLFDPRGETPNLAGGRVLRAWPELEIELRRRAAAAA